MTGTMGYTSLPVVEGSRTSVTQQSVTERRLQSLSPGSNAHIINKSSILEAKRLVLTRDLPPATVSLDRSCGLLKPESSSSRDVG